MKARAAAWLRWAAAFLCAVAVAAHAQSPDPEAATVPAPEPGSELQVSVLTFAPGDIYWQRFGHDAIRVKNIETGRSVVYNYGVFDFRQEDFLLNFARGRMRYQLVRDDFDRTVRAYRAEGRWIVEQVLAIEPAARLDTYEFLEWNARPENAEYHYNYFEDNCATRVRDVIDRALGGALRTALSAQATDATWRSDATRLMAPDAALMVGIDFALGTPADQPLDRWQRSFVPMELMAALRDVQVPGADGSRHALVASERRVLDIDSPQPPENAPALWPWTLPLGLLLGGLLLSARRRNAVKIPQRSFSLLATFLTLVCALAGVVLAGFWTLTEHTASWCNVNILIANPLCLFLIPTWWRARRAAWEPLRLSKTLALLVALGAALAVIPALLTAGTTGPFAWWLLLMPVHAALAWVCLYPQGRKKSAATVNESRSAA